MIRSGLAATLLLLALAPTRTLAADIVVLVANPSLQQDEINSLTVRKVFLGLPTRSGDILLRGVRNVGDQRLTDVFLQTVVAMSQRSYDHRLLAQALQSGAPLPLEVSDHEKLVKVLTTTPGAVSYMWYEDAVRYPSIQIVRVLWRSD